MVRKILRAVLALKNQIKSFSDCEFITLLGSDPETYYVSNWTLEQEGPRWEFSFRHRGPVLHIGSCYSVVTPANQRLLKGTVIAAATNSEYQYIVIRGTGYTYDDTHTETTTEDKEIH